MAARARAACGHKVCAPCRHESSRRPPAGVSAFLARFALGYVACHALYFALPDVIVQELIHAAIAAPAAAIIELWAPAEAVREVQGSLVSPRATLEIVRGCDGAGAAFLLGAAIVAFPSPWARRLQGVALGMAFVYLLNELRLIALYGVVAYRQDWFGLLHGYVVPIAVVAAAAAFFGWWMPPRVAPD